MIEFPGDFSFFYQFFYYSSLRCWKDSFTRAKNKICDSRSWQCIQFCCKKKLNCIWNKGNQPEINVKEITKCVHAYPVIKWVWCKRLFFFLLFFHAHNFILLCSRLHIQTCFFLLLIQLPNINVFKYLCYSWVHVVCLLCFCFYFILIQNLLPITLVSFLSKHPNIYSKNERKANSDQP